MPSRLRARTRFSRSRDTIKNSDFHNDILIPKAIKITGPWKGYVPDIESNLLDARAFRSSMGFIQQGGSLVQDNGFAQLVPAEMPLGDTSPPAAAADASPVVGLFQYRPIDGSSTIQLALASMEEGGTAGVEFGHLYQYDGTNWNHRAQSAVSRQARQISNSLPDWAFIPWLDIDHNGTGAPGTGQVVFCDNDIDSNRVYVYPDGTPNYFDFPLGGFTDFTAKSVESFASRVNWLFTTEDSTEFPVRLRYTAGLSTSLTALGSGTIDFDQVEGPGLRLEKLGDDMAAYFADGVIMIRRTGLAAVPYIAEVLTTRRGILSTQSLVKLGRSVHFGIFDDGWFFLDSTGRWREAGVEDFGGQLLTKWKRKFYDTIDYSQRGQIVCTYDRRRRGIRIAFPDSDATNGHPNNVWFYDLQTDTVWPDNYGVDVPISWLEWDDSSVSESWDSQADTWDDIVRDWAEEESIGQYRMTHGTVGGLVMQHDSSISTRDGRNIVCTLETYDTDLGSLSALKHPHRLYVEYTHTNNPSSITAGLQIDDTLVSNSIVPNKGSPGSTQLDFITASQSGRRVAITIGSNAPVGINGFQLEYFIEGGSLVERGVIS